MMVETAHLDVGYGKRKVITDANIEVGPGSIVTLIGPNGSGKSTVLKTITGQLADMGGSISICGKEVCRQSAAELAKHISMLMTERIRPELMTCRDVIATGRYPYTGKLGILSDTDRIMINETVEMTGLGDIEDMSFEKISDGQRQRVMLARAICQDTEIIVLDEPTSYLDMKYKIELLKLIRLLAHEKNKAIIMSLHELDLARAVSDTVICVGEGRVVKAGSPEEIYKGDFIQKLFGIEAGEFNPSTGQMILR